ncbi:hypothetical protein [Telluribacter sp. SYSU D00476]|uniref:hypothetical protein n=1 Tax=Telluribacter sp. SYSU D00476 TaxID=2811430 RepID=UPI001FF6539A|nr:hypothetical protein [Telluribacter sp. SYSU D00476]
MKKLLTFAFALFTLTASFASTETATTPEKGFTFNSSAYTSVTTQQLHVAVEKQEGRKVQIQLLNEQGDVLVDEVVGKKKNSYRARIEVNHLQDGTYKLLITDGTTTQSRTIKLSTSAPVTAPARVVSLQ